MEYRTCTYIRDDGNICNSAAVTDRNLCLFHLSHRARLMRQAQYRARGLRFDLILPPLESMHAVQSALTQLSEALAADMIDLKRADRLIRVLNLSSRNLLKADKWPASPYHSEQPAPAVDLTAEYGIPNDLDLMGAPPMGGPQLPDVGNCGDDPQVGTGSTGAPPLSPFFGDRVGAPDNRQLPTDNCSPMPTAGYCSEHGYDCPDLVIRADHPVTPEHVELVEISRTQGADAAARRSGQLERNRRLRQLRHDRKRYAAIALEKNMRLAAEKLAEQKLAARKPPASVASGETIAAKEEATA